MQKKAIIAALLFACAFLVFAQEENRFSFGIGPEWNMDSRMNFAGGLGASLDVHLDRSLVVGASYGISHNFGQTMVMEAYGIVRVYFPKGSYTGFFAQTDMGAFFLFEENETSILYLTGFRAGYRFTLGKRYYVEPYGRIGFPFMFGIGAMAGVTF